MLFATVGAAYLPLGRLHFPIAMAIAAAKAVLIVAVTSCTSSTATGSPTVISAASFLWLGIMIALTLTDYLTRGWLDIPGK